MEIRNFADVKVLIKTEDILKTNVVYCLTFPNGKKYIGQTTQTLKERLRQHCKYSFNKKLSDFNLPKGRAIRKYLEFTAEILYEGGELDYWEIEYIKLFDSTNVGYNITIGGNDGCVGYKHSEEMKQHISEKLIGNTNSLGRKDSQETKDKRNKNFYKPVLQYDLDGNFIAEYSSVKEAKELNAGCSKLDAVCRGERKTAGGFTWKYKE